MAGAVFYDLSPEELCDLICGQPEEDEYEEGVDYYADGSSGGE